MRVPAVVPFLLLSQLLACGDGLVGGPTEETAPTISSTTPTAGATALALDTIISATFSEAMDPTTISVTSFTVLDGTTPVPGEVSYAGVIATFDPGDRLDVETLYTATVHIGATDLAHNPLAADYTWVFTTGPGSDTEAPRVSFTVPADDATGVARSGSIAVAFSEAMDPATISTTSFTLRQSDATVAGTVTYTDVTATFNPTSTLAADTLYSAAVTTAARDLAGNPLARTVAWSFRTGATVDTTRPTIIATLPLDDATDVVLDTNVTATFSEVMDPLTLTATTFTVRDGTIVIDGALTRIGDTASFDPTGPLDLDTEYTATITTGVSDLAGNALDEDAVWTFTTGDTPAGLIAPDLGTLSTFVAVAGAGLTNSNSSGTTTLNGDVGLTPAATCLGDGSPCTATNPVINGTLYANDPEGVAIQAKVDLTAAYVDATSRPVGTTVNDITGMTLPPGVYTSDSTMSIAVDGTLTLDGQGDANAVWIFQIGSSLTVNNNAQVLLINGASAKNVFWAVFASSTLGSNVSFQGTILAGAANSVGTDSVVVGRLLCTTGQITLLSNTITLPPL